MSISAFDPKQTWHGAANQTERSERGIHIELVHIAQDHEWTIWENQFRLQAHLRTKFATALNG